MLINNSKHYRSHLGSPDTFYHRDSCSRGHFPYEIHFSQSSFLSSHSYSKILARTRTEIKHTEKAKKKPEPQRDSSSASLIGESQKRPKGDEGCRARTTTKTAQTIQKGRREGEQKKKGSKEDP
ncbi:hypothetical protein CDAR_296571 [Caerostris darwini]|uniref:Uncharacterized protein n=1 Tax=Caerostris darwini TaxID=1538125 RepID=A0AAV4PM72_9ARAC|nr:hypothetical protein CDAR_296571 [Caerostris darwini]